MELGLDVVAVYENGIIYDKKVLDVDQDQFLKNMMSAVSGAKAIALEIRYCSKDTIGDLIAKAHRQAKCLGVEANILVPGVINELLAKAQRQLMGLKQAANI
jgi:large subunit ribosomal protein L10